MKLAILTQFAQFSQARCYEVHGQRDCSRRSCSNNGYPASKETCASSNSNFRINRRKIADLKWAAILPITRNARSFLPIYWSNNDNTDTSSAERSKFAAGWNSLIETAVNSRSQKIETRSPLNDPRSPSFCDNLFIRQQQPVTENFNRGRALNDALFA